MNHEERFAFGKNWQNFLRYVDESRVDAAEASLRRMLAREHLQGLRFLDAGCGSGLFSLAAVGLGAEVHSFDYDANSVECTRELQRRFAGDRQGWQIEPGSVLDREYLQQLGEFEIVYSWGVLHHTGDMWLALEYLQERVKPGGLLAISIYNDQGGASRRWTWWKRLYNRSPGVLRWLIAASFFALHEGKQACIRLLRGRNPLPYRDWAQLQQQRGMTAWHDAVDWIGGYPFEVARPEQIFDFLKARGFKLIYLTTQAGGYGCNEFVLEREHRDLETTASA